MVSIATAQHCFCAPASSRCNSTLHLSSPAPHRSSVQIGLADPHAVCSTSGRAWGHGLRGRALGAAKHSDLEVRANSFAGASPIRPRLVLDSASGSVGPRPSTSYNGSSSNLQAGPSSADMPARSQSVAVQTVPPPAVPRLQPPRLPRSLPPAVPEDVIQEFEHKLEADLQTVAVTIMAILGVIIFWRGVWALLDHYIGDSVLGDLCCIIVGLAIVLYIRLSGLKIASFWPPS